MLTFPIDQLRQLLIYDPFTGELRNRVNRPPRAKAGELATRRDSKGYLHVSIGGTYYRAHRIAWALFFDRWPDGEIDHISGNRTDNRLFNLRSCSHRENRRNNRLRVDNRSGWPGVWYRAKHRHWVARIRADDRHVYLGSYPTRGEAIMARILAENEHGYLTRHA